MEAREVLEKVKNNEISIEEAEKCIQEEIYEKMGGWDEVVATCIGHTHIDVAWLWDPSTRCVRNPAESFCNRIKTDG